MAVPKKKISKRRCKFKKFISMQKIKNKMAPVSDVYLKNINKKILNIF